MKESRTKQGQRNTQSLLALLVYRMAQGPVEIEPFADILQKIASDRINGVSIDPSLLFDSQAHVDVAKLLKKKRFKRKSEYFQDVYQRYFKDTNLHSDISALTVGDIVSGWADITGQDKAEFILKVYPKISALVVENNHAANSGPKQDTVNNQIEDAFKFMEDLFLILIEETPPDKRDALVAQMQNLISHNGFDLDIDLPDEVFSISSRLLISDVVTKMDKAFSINPAAKASFQQPLFGALIEIIAKKYGWDSGVPADNDTKLLVELKERGLFFNKRIHSLALKELARRNIFLNIDSALCGTLTDDLKKTILAQRTDQQTKTESVWIYEQISPEAEAEVEKRVLDFLFRRDGNDTGRNH